MPLYEYHCRDCDYDFERLESLHGAPEPAECRRCGSRRVERIEFSRVAVATTAGGGEACCSPAPGGA